jgi:hypothetical protein
MRLLDLRVGPAGQAQTRHKLARQLSATRNAGVSTIGRGALLRPIRIKTRLNSYLQIRVRLAWAPMLGVSRIHPPSAPTATDGWLAATGLAL